MRQEVDDKPQYEAARMIVKAGKHVTAEAQERLELFQKNYARTHSNISSWTQDLAWAWSDPEWAQALMIAKLEG